MSMTVKEFLLSKTHIGELCMVTSKGWPVTTVWIDCEELIALNAINSDVKRKIVKSDSYGEIKIRNHDGSYINVPCHYIDT